MRIRAWKIALGALLVLAAMAIVVNVTSHAAQAAPAPGQIFIDLNGNATYDPATETLYAKVQYAIDNATAGQTVMVGAGTYTEQLSIDKGISLVGASMANTTISCPATLSTLPSIISVFGDTSVNMTGLRVSGPGSALGTGLYVIGGSHVHVWDCAFDDIRHSPVDSSTSPICIKLGNATTLSVGTGLIEDCLFTDWQRSAIQVDSAGSYAEVRGCVIQGWSTYSTVVVQVGVHVLDSATAYIHDNNISDIGGTGSGRGVILENGGAAVIEHNQLTGLNMTGDTAIGVYMQNSGAGTIASNNTIEYWLWGCYVTGTSTGPKLADNLIANNRGSGVQLTNAANTAILRNDFIANGLDTTGNGLVVTAGSANSVARYNNFIGNYYGLWLSVNVPFDATLNYWGSYSGPSGSGLGIGDEIHESVGHPVSWNPWLRDGYPPAVPISGIGSKLTLSDLLTFDLSGSAGISVQMTGSGTPLVTAFRYSINPVGPFYGLMMDRFIDVHISSDSGVTQLTVSVFYNQTDLPVGMVESDLQVYWWDGAQWAPVSDSSVDTDANILTATFSAGTTPTLAQLVGTPFMCATPSVTVDPVTGPSGTLVTAHGTGFYPHSSVSVRFADNVIATSATAWNGNVTMVCLVPVAQPGGFLIEMVDSHSGRATTPFLVEDDSALSILVDVGPLHFRGEEATFWATASLNGAPVDLDNYTATFYLANMSVVSLNATRIATGLYRIDMSIPLSAGFGDSALVMTGSNGSHQGVGMSVVEISQTLTGFGAQLTAIQGGVATIQTDVGAIQMDLAAMNATLTSVDAGVATLQTDVGRIQADLALINATLTSVNGTLAVIQTDFGALMLNISSIDARLASIDGSIATIQTELGSISGNITSIDGRLATLETSVGTLQVDVTAIGVTLVGVTVSLAEIQTTLGRIDLNLTAVNAHLTAIDGTLATVQTSLGTVQASLDAIDARLVSMQGTLATVNTTCGALTVSLAALNAKVTQIGDNVVQIQTTLGTINGEIVSMQGSLATIQTDLGTVSADVKDAQNNSNNNSTVIIVLLILVLVILIGLYFWKLRKVL